MLTITVQIDAPAGAAQAAKECLAMAMEPVGIARVVEVREDAPKQQTLWQSPAVVSPPTPERPHVTPESAAGKIYMPETVGALLALYRSGDLHDAAEQARLEAIYKAASAGRHKTGSGNWTDNPPASAKPRCRSRESKVRAAAHTVARGGTEAKTKKSK